MTTAPDADVLVIGAGAAGIAAARALHRAGRKPLLIEARSRLGGRAWTRMFGDIPVDLGAHWIHAARSNPLIPLAAELGRPVKRAVYRFRAYRHGRPLGLAARWGLDTAWEKAEDRLFEAAERAERSGRDISVAEAVGALGPWTEAALFLHGRYDCGAAPETISAIDFARVEDDRDMLVEGGLGRLVLDLALGLPAVTGAEIGALDWTAAGVTATAADGRSWRAPRAIVTVPAMVLASGAIRITPAPTPWLETVATMHPAAYEHVLLKGSGTPWSGRDDQIVLSMNGETTLALFGHMDGTDLHYLDLVAEEGRRLATLAPEQRAPEARRLLDEHFGADRMAGIETLAVTDWAADPFALGAWALASIGAAGRRLRLREPVGPLLYAGEAASSTQWGTVGGAWLEGERAASQILEAGA